MDLHAVFHRDASESVHNRLPAAVQIQDRPLQAQLHLLDRRARTLSTPDRS